MKHPPYHLRVNKAIDRFILVEIINILKKYCRISDYTYYGFGGPFLEDCKLINDRCPEIKIVSIEEDGHTFKRQEFHRFSKNLDLRHEDSDSFLANFSSTGKEIFWFDYTNLKFGHFEDFMKALDIVSDNSIIKITVQAQPPLHGLSPKKHKEEWDKKWIQFQQEYSRILPASTRQIDISRLIPFVKLLQNMFKITSQRILPASGESVFQLLDSSYYNDQIHNMLSITGIVCNECTVPKINQWFKDWKFSNLDWAAPRQIDVPLLSIKERLHLEKHLPTKTKTGISLSRSLGYNIDRTDSKSLEKLKQYEEFYQYYPYFARLSI